VTREIQPHFDKVKWATVFNLHIDPEFKNLLGSLSDEDRLALSDSIGNEGCRDALIAWPQKDGSAILLDGHHRHEICEKYRHAYRVVECPDYVTDRQSAITWIINNQRARRNINPNRVAYLRGKAYLAAKNEHGGDRKSAQQKSSDQNDHLIERQTTAERLADDFMISAPTIRRNAKFAEQVDDIAAKYGSEAKEDILEGLKDLCDYALREPETPVQDTLPETESTAEEEASPSPAPDLSSANEHDPEVKPEIPSDRAKVSDYRTPLYADVEDRPEILPPPPGVYPAAPPRLPLKRASQTGYDMIAKLRECAETIATLRDLGLPTAATEPAVKTTIFNVREALCALERHLNQEPEE